MSASFSYCIKYCCQKVWRLSDLSCKVTCSFCLVKGKLFLKSNNFIRICQGVNHFRSIFLVSFYILLPCSFENFFNSRKVFRCFFFLFLCFGFLFQRFLLTYTSRVPEDTHKSYLQKRICDPRILYLPCLCLIFVTFSQNSLTVFPFT